MARFCLALICRHTRIRPPGPEAFPRQLEEQISLILLPAAARAEAEKAGE